MWKIFSRKRCGECETVFGFIKSQLQYIINRHSEDHKNTMATLKDVQDSQTAILDKVQSDTSEFAAMLADSIQIIKDLKVQQGPVTQEQLDGLEVKNTEIMTRLNALSDSVKAGDASLTEAPPVVDTPVV